MTTIVPVDAVGTTRTVAAGGAVMFNGHRWDGEDGRGWYERDDYDPSPWLWLEIAQDRTQARGLLRSGLPELRSIRGSASHRAARCEDPLA
jgi:hypothetical protein